MPKYQITISKKYLVEVESKTLDKAKKDGWEKHMALLAEGKDFPVRLKIDHVRIREDEEILTFNQKKRLNKKIKEVEAKIAK